MKVDLKKEYQMEKGNIPDKMGIIMMEIGKKGNEMVEASCIRLKLIKKY